MAAKTFLNTDLLLVGKTGHGKSATGNSILGREAFDSFSSMDSVTNNVDFDVSKVGNRVIMVVDVPGVCDTGENEDAGLSCMFETAIAANPKGYHALLLVYKYSSRYTKEEVETIAYLKQLLGNNFIKNHAIVVVTNGDTFENDGNSRDDFEKWCRNQSGPFRQLLEECSFRSVLFNNHSKDNTVLTAQRDTLLNIIDTKLQGKRYDHALFKQAQNIEEIVIKEERGPKVTSEMLNTCSLILQDNVENPDKVSKLNDLAQTLKTSSLHKKTFKKDEDENSADLDDLMEMTRMMELLIAEEDDVERIKADKKSKTMPLKAPSKTFAIGHLAANVRPSKFAPIYQNDFYAAHRMLKNIYNWNVTSKIALKLHEGISASKA